MDYHIVCTFLGCTVWAALVLPVLCVQYQSCDCSCGNLNTNLESDPVLQQQIKELKENLTIDAKSTNAHARTLISVKDSRPSAEAAGYVGVLLLAFIGAFMLLIDLTRVFNFFIELRNQHKHDTNNIMSDTE